MAVVHILMPLNIKAKNWVDKHIDPKLMHFGNGVVILDSNYLDAIVAVMESSGFKKGLKKDIGTKAQSKLDFIVSTMS